MNSDYSPYAVRRTRWWKRTQRMIDVGYRKWCKRNGLSEQDEQYDWHATKEAEARTKELAKQEAARFVEQELRKQELRKQGDKHLGSGVRATLASGQRPVTGEGGEVL